MSRRLKKSESGFGSDSFLDIVANIVGILIILIVIAGLRVSQAPVKSNLSTAAVPNISEKRETNQPLPQPILPSESLSSAPLWNPPIENQSKKDREENRSLVLQKKRQKFQRNAEQIQNEIAGIEGKLARGTVQLQEVLSTEDKFQGKIRIVSQALLRETESRKQAQEEVARQTRELEKKEQELSALQKQLKEQSQKEVPVQKIRHKMTPVSQLVKGKEIHFRLAENRVAFVPLDDLVDELKNDIRKHKDWLVKYRKHQGQVGPLGGFLMEYTVQRKSMSVVDEIRMGGSGVQIAVSQWKLKPQNYLKTESAEKALQPDSKFMQVLRQTDPETTLTFWVYPDSFALYRKLQRQAHAADFTVAARPLPFGVPIAGSPQGSRSAGQ